MATATPARTRKPKPREKGYRRLVSCLRCRDLCFALLDGGELLKLVRPSKSSRYRIRLQLNKAGVRLSDCQSLGTNRKHVHGVSCLSWDFSPPVQPPRTRSRSRA